MRYASVTWLDIVWKARATVYPYLELLSHYSLGVDSSMRTEMHDPYVSRDLKVSQGI